MAYCQNCGITIPDNDRRTLCQDCETAGTPTDSGDWVGIAKMTNLAEAGFLSDLLDSKGIPAKLDQRDDFSAVDGGWRTSFTLRVPPDHHTRALSFLRDEVAEYHAEEEADDLWDAEPATILDVLRRQRGVPIVAVVLLMGMVALSAYAAGRASKNPFGEPGIPQALWKAMTDSTQPYFAVWPDGKLQRRLQFDKNKRTLILEVDVDGDGRFDRRQEFREDSFINEKLVQQP
jgi:hypothetical protein